jgi:hypothetical protein
VMTHDGPSGASTQERDGAWDVGCEGSGGWDGGGGRDGGPKGACASSLTATTETTAPAVSSGNRARPACHGAAGISGISREEIAEQWCGSRFRAPLRPPERGRCHRPRPRGQFTPGQGRTRAGAAPHEAQHRRFRVVEPGSASPAPHPTAPPRALGRTAPRPVRLAGPEAGRPFARGVAPPAPHRDRKDGCGATEAGRSAASTGAGRSAARPGR